MSGKIRLSGFVRGPLPLVWLLPLVFLSFSGFFSSRILVIRAQHPEDTTGTAGERGILFVLSKKPSFSLGFRNVLADVVWLEAIQVAGNRKMTMKDYTRLYDLLNVVANFDPKFSVPYILGGLVLGESLEHAQEALRILERGKASHPADWRFPFYIGFTQYFSLGNPKGGGNAMAEAARLPGCPPYLAGIASRMLSEAREPETALALLEALAGQQSDPVWRSVLERRAREVIVERDLQVLERGVERYRVKTGSLPDDLLDLVREGILPAIPKEPNGGKYLLGKGGAVRSDRMADRLRMFRKP